MEINSVDDIFDENQKIRVDLRELLNNITAETATTFMEGQAWTIAQIVEHIAAVEESSSKICSKLLSKAKADDDRCDGSVFISEDFDAKAREIHSMKLEAPERVQPSGRQLAESLAKLEENSRWLEDLKPLFKTYDGTSRKFPHPFFGPLSAQEWLLLSGMHAKRHTEQIKRLMDK